MKTHLWLAGVAAGLLFAGAVDAQTYPMADRVAQKIVQKYQTSSCQQLWAEKAQKAAEPKSPMEQRAIQLLQQDPAMRQYFINQIAGPVVNKMFECGMLP
jgi:hypothetical protein